MRIFFVQNRFHTNQYFPIKKLQDEGHTVKYLTAKQNVDGRDVVTPEAVKFSLPSKILASFTRLDKDGFMWEYGIPSFRWLYKKIQSFDPDAIVVKRLKPISLSTIAIGSYLGIKTIVYDQIPAYGRQRLLRTMLRKTHELVTENPLIEYTPVEGDRFYDSVQDTYFVPFVMDYDFDFEQKEYFRNNQINLLTIGGLDTKRKDHLLLLDAVRELQTEYDIHLTILGQVPDVDDPNYSCILNFIAQNELENVVELKGTVEFEDMSREYARHDVYVLPSYDEPAAVSHLEAMAHGLPAICSDSNGTKYYIDEGETGYIFRSRDSSDLTKKLRRIIRDQNELVHMGKRSYEQIRSEYNPDIYNDRLIELIESI